MLFVCVNLSLWKGFFVSISVMSRDAQEERKKRPRAPRAVPSFSEHRNTVLLRYAMQNDASMFSFRKPPIRGSVTNCVDYLKFLVTQVTGVSA